MNCLNKLFFLIPLSFFFNGCTNVSKESLVDFKRTVVVQNNIIKIPKNIKEELLQQFPSVEIIKKEDYSKLFWDFYDSDTIPNECFTDINNDQLLDYAVLVKKGNNLKLVIITSSKKGYSYWISPFSEKINSEGVNFCITIKPAGRIDVVKKVPESLVLKKNGFLLKNLEQDTLIFYEVDNTIKTFKML
jgi:hypothetical protein